MTEASTIAAWSEIYGGMKSVQVVMPSTMAHVYYANEAHKYKPTTRSFLNDESNGVAGSSQ